MASSGTIGPSSRRPYPDEGAARAAPSRYFEIMSRRPLVRDDPRWSFLSNLFLVVGIGLMVLALVGYAQASLAQAALKSRWDERPILPAVLPSAAERPASPASARGELGSAEAAGESAADSTPVFREGDPVARLSIPRIGLDAVVLEGISRGTLALAPGRYPGMPLPGDGGHAVLSAHRDSFFRRLGELEPGDRISLTRWDGRPVAYEVARTFIVHKTNRTVIVPTDEEVLTLITCYPFVYAGSAPYRYIVQASPAGSLPSS